MSRLRKPIRALREPFGKAGLTVAILALVLAMVGGAYAAGGLTKSQEKQVTKIAKKYAGKPGAAGANGTNGNNGAPGAKGDAGAAGSNGAPGANGKSVVIGTATTCGEAGGKTVEVEGSGVKSNVCNGKNGTTGFTSTLPSGKTEEGTWAVTYNATVEGEELIQAPISFPIPLAAPVTAEYVTSPTTGCPGSSGEPKAEAGFFCMYQQFSTLSLVGFANLETGGGFGETAKFGDIANFKAAAAGQGFGRGTWAVTAK